jgi:Cupredoxin-like domain
MIAPFANRNGRLTVLRSVFAGVTAAVMLVAITHHARAEEDPTFRIEFKDGVVNPLRLQVPAKRRFRLELHNLGQTPAEFESRELRKEKVLAPGTSSTLVIRTLDPGEYEFFDDFHLGAPPAVLVAK